jgi:hypothetical protein
VPRQFQIPKPRHLRDGAVKKRMRVMREAGQARIGQRAQATAGLGRAVERQRAQSGAREIGLGDEAVVTGAEEEGVVVWHQEYRRSASSAFAREG